MKNKIQTRKVKQTKNKKKSSKLKKLLNSSHTIIIALIILIVILIIYCNYLLKSNVTYMFNASGEYVNIYNGIITLNYDVNIFEGSDIDYVPEKDVVVTKYKIGYYVKDGDNLIPIAVNEDKDEEGLSLKAILEGISSFNVTELNKNDKHFNKQSVKLLNDGLYFVIEATDKDGNVITNVTDMNMTRISK